ncbi:MAG: formylglycine-generating enzyme family protein [Planctomycetales bacterium]|nr:formylglycine-generating enzyme family protein [Planctomycetales bacterium]
MILGMTLGADPADANDEQLQLLKRFRDEFVVLAPGKDKFPGSFQMGDDQGPAEQRPAHRVSFGYSFAIAKYEVPQNLWEAVMGSNPSRWKGPRNSVEMLTYEEAADFCRRCTKLMRSQKLIDEHEEIRLPSEAEWEYAARAGTNTVYSFGDRVADLDAYAWHTGNAAGNDPPVGALKPNPWGLYDMHGYLWEWCLDSGTDDYQDAPADGSARQEANAKTRVIRGGSWKDPAASMSSRARAGEFRHAGGTLKFRGGVPADTKDDAIGLRCVLASGKRS